MWKVHSPKILQNFKPVQTKKHLVTVIRFIKMDHFSFFLLFFPFFNFLIKYAIFNFFFPLFFLK